MWRMRCRDSNWARVHWKCTPPRDICAAVWAYWGRVASPTCISEESFFAILFFSCCFLPSVKQCILQHKPSPIGDLWQCDFVVGQILASCCLSLDVTANIRIILIFANIYLQNDISFKQCAGATCKCSTTFLPLLWYYLSKSWYSAGIGKSRSGVGDGHYRSLTIRCLQGAFFCLFPRLWKKNIRFAFYSYLCMVSNNYRNK